MKRTLLLSAIAALLSLATSSAEAAFFVTVNVPSNTLTGGGFAGGSWTANDNAAGTLSDSALASGTITFVNPGAIGSQLTFDGTFRSVSNASSVTLFLDEFNIRNRMSGPASALHDITVTVVQDNLTFNSGTLSTLTSNLLVGSGSALISYQLTSNLSSPTIPTATATVITAGSDSKSINLVPGSPYTLTAVYTIPTLVGAQITLGNFPNGSASSVVTNATPEPASLAAWGGMGLFGLVMAARRRKQK
jgi:MYXO-CTERM domain-containing protein